MKIPLVGQSATPRSLAAGAQQTMNLIAEKVEDGNEQQKGGWALYGAPGRHLFKDLTAIDAAAHPVRGLFSGGGRLFVAAGTKYFEIDSSGALVGLAYNIADDAAHSPVTFFSNGNQLLLISAGTAYCDNGGGPVAITYPALSGQVVTINTLVLYAATPNSVTGHTDYFDVGMEGQAITINAVVYTVQVVVNPSMLRLTTSAGITANKDWSCTPILTASSGAVLDGYFIVSRSGQRQMNSSALLDGTTWSGLNFATKESSTDHIRSVLAHGEQLYVFGATEGSEVWQVDPQNTAFKFTRLDGAAARFNSASAWGPISIGGKVHFIGGDSEGQLTAYRIDGFTPVRISTHAEESAWNAAGLGATIISYGYSEEGHEFWVINFGTQCWAWDITEKQWAERGQWSGSAFTAYDTKYHTFIQNDVSSSNVWGAGKHITGGDASSASGKLYESSVNFYDDNGSDIGWRRALPYRFNDGKLIYFGRMELEMETGTTSAAVTEPTVTRDSSDDRGHTFTNAETAGIGLTTDYTRRVYWINGGSSSGRVWRLSGAGQIKVALVSLDSEEWAGTV